MLKSKILIISIVCLLGLPLIGYLYIDDDSSRSEDIVKFPTKIDSECRDGTALLYDECSSQVELFNQALKFAVENDKTLLISYGAEWCIWCHVFEAYINGEHTKFDHVYADPSAPDEKYTARILEKDITNDIALAPELSEFVANSYVVVHIEDKFSPDGYDVLVQSEADQHTNGGLPFVFSVDSQGKYIEQIYWDEVEVRRDTDDWYRGYDRSKLINALEKMVDKAKN